MDLLLGPALGLVLSPADITSGFVAVLHERSPADLGCLVEGDLLVLDETALPEVLLALLLLLGLVVGDVGGVTPPVARVVALHHIVVLCLLDHLHLVNTSLAVRARTGGSYSTKADISSRVSLTVSSAVKRSHRGGGSVVVAVVFPMVLLAALLVEGEGASQGAGAPLLVVPQLTSSQS